MTKFISIREELDNIEKVLNILDTTNRDLTDEEQGYLDNFPHTLALAILCSFCPDTCKQVINHLSKELDDSCDFGDEYTKVTRCGWCKWWKDCRCTNVNGAYGNTIFNPNWFCRSGESIMEDT